jgi:dihydropyrimidinase
MRESGRAEDRRMVSTGAAELVIEGGTVVTDEWQRPAAVVIANGRITDILDNGASTSVAAERRIDATGRLVVPGGVDPHCHIGIAVGAYTTLDTYESASLAALAGGTTTMVDFAIPGPNEDPVASLDERLRLAAGSRCDYAEHGCINTANANIPAVVRALAERGVRTVKLFTTYRGILMVDTGTIEAVMIALNAVSGLTYVHAEANDVVEAAQTVADDEDRIGASGHAHTRPPEAEDRAVAAVLAAAGRVGAPVYFVHQSTPRAIELVQEAQRQGVTAFTESCPHYLTLDDTKYDGPNPERWVCCPPLRDRPTVDALAELAIAGAVDTVGSDNCCYDTHQKRERANDVREMPNGLPGVETRLPIVFDRFVVRGGMIPERFVAMVAANPARLNGLYPRKGTIAIGSDADVAIIDPSETRTISAADLHMPTDYSPYEGQSVTGWPTTVVSRGRIVVDEGRLIDPGPVGEFIPAQPIDASAVRAQLTAHG